MAGVTELSLTDKESLLLQEKPYWHVLIPIGVVFWFTEIHSIIIIMSHWWSSLYLRWMHWLQNKEQKHRLNVPSSSSFWTIYPAWISEHQAHSFPKLRNITFFMLTLKLMLKFIVTQSKEIVEWGTNHNIHVLWLKINRHSFH